MGASCLAKWVSQGNWWRAQTTFGWELVWRGRGTTQPPNWWRAQTTFAWELVWGGEAPPNPQKKRNHFSVGISTDKTHGGISRPSTPPPNLRNNSSMGISTTKYIQHNQRRN